MTVSRATDPDPVATGNEPVQGAARVSLYRSRISLQHGRPLMSDDNIRSADKKALGAEYRRRKNTLGSLIG